MKVKESFKVVDVDCSCMSLEPSLLFSLVLALSSIPPLHLGWGGVSPALVGWGFQQSMTVQGTASYSWDTLAPRYPLSRWPRTSHWDADVTSTIPYLQLMLEVTMCQVCQSSCRPWRLLGIIDKFSHSFYSEGAKLSILSNKHWSNDRGAMSSWTKTALSMCSAS